MDLPKVYRKARSSYASDNWIRDFVDMHCLLSLDKASVVPEPDEPWLDSLSAAALDYWKVGELYMAKLHNKIVYCDPVDVRTGQGSTASDSGYVFEFPDYWSRVHRQDPVFVLNLPDPYAVRGVPVTYHQLTVLAKQEQLGHPEKLSPAIFGFGDKKTNQDIAIESAKKIMHFRRKLGQALNILWPHMKIDMFVVNPSDVLTSCKNFGFL